MRLKIEELEIELKRKRIKHMHLYVKAPDGHVEVSAPLRMRQEDILMFLYTRLDWIREKRAHFQHQIHISPRYQSGEMLPLWGTLYPLSLYPADALTGQSSDAADETWIRLAGNSLHFDGQRLQLYMEADAPQERREQLVLCWYHRQLEQKIRERLPQLERESGLHSNGWQVKKMRTRWGSCNVRTGKLHLSLYLAQAEPRCLDYVLLHELAHTRVPNHGPDFKALMDALMPDWRSVKAQLNGQTGR